MTDEELRKIAENATPGPWESWNVDDETIEVRAGSALEGAGGYRSTDMILERDVSSCDLDGEVFKQTEADADFIATFNPATVLALLDRVEKAEGELDLMEQTLDLSKMVEDKVKKKLDWAEQALQRVRDRHQPCLSCLEPHCFVCEKAQWPCAEFRALEGDE